MTQTERFDGMPAAMPDLREIEARLSAGNIGRHTDFHVGKAFGLYPSDIAMPYEGRDATWCQYNADNSRTVTGAIILPWTTSIDAAAALMPRGFDWSVDSRGRAMIWNNTIDIGTDIKGKPAAALVLAIIRAVIAELESAK